MFSDDDLRKALRRAFQLGQTYWMHADSESVIQHQKAERVQASFDELMEETVAAANGVEVRTMADLIAVDRATLERAAAALAAYMSAMRVNVPARDVIMDRIRSADRQAQPVYAELYGLLHPHGVLAAVTAVKLERIAVGAAVLPGLKTGDEYDEPEVQPYVAVLEALQERLVRDGRDVTLELFVEVPDGVEGTQTLPAVLSPKMHTALFHGLGISGRECEARYQAMLAAVPHGVLGTVQPQQENNDGR